MMRFLDRFTWRGKSVIAVLVLALVMGVGMMIGSRPDRLETGPAPGGDGVTSSPAAPGGPAAGLSLPAGDSTSVTSSTGVDYGAGLPRLEGSAFAQTSDPTVFAASVQAGMGYDYTSYQPTDLAAEADRINQEILAGMTGSDGPLGAGVHDALRSAVTRSTNVDELAYRVAAHQLDETDITSVEVLDNETLHQDVGDAAYATIIANRAKGVFQYAVTSSVTTTVQAVGDTAGWTRTQTSKRHMLVHCPSGGYCSLIGIIGSEVA